MTRVGILDYGNVKVQNMFECAAMSPGKVQVTGYDKVNNQYIVHTTNSNNISIDYSFILIQEGTTAWFIGVKLYDVIRQDMTRGDYQTSDPGMLKGLLMSLECNG
jgi:hypothetical protein